MKTWLAFWVVVTVCCGCAVSSGHRVGAAAQGKTDPASVQVLYEAPSRPFTVIGYANVARSILLSEEAAERKFKDVAASMGGDAVIVDVFPQGMNAFSNNEGHGRVIRWK